MNIFKNVIVSSMMLFAALFSVSTLKVSAIDVEGSKESACKGLNLGSDSNCDTEGASVIEKALEAVLTILSMVAGIIAVIMMIITGIRYITSNGDSSSVKAAKNTLIYALVGVVIVILSQSIVQFVIKRAETGTSTVEDTNTDTETTDNESTDFNGDPCDNNRPSELC